MEVVFLVFHFGIALFILVGSFGLLMIGWRYWWEFTKNVYRDARDLICEIRRGKL